MAAGAIDVGYLGKCGPDLLDARLSARDPLQTFVKAAILLRHRERFLRRYAFHIFLPRPSCCAGSCCGVSCSYDATACTHLTGVCGPLLCFTGRSENVSGAVPSQPPAIAAAERITEAHDSLFHNASEGDVEAREKYIRIASILRNLRNQRVPDVLVAWNQPNRRRDCIIIKDFDSSLVFSGSHPCR